MKTPTRLLYVASMLFSLAACATPAATIAPTVENPIVASPFPEATIAAAPTPAPPNLLLSRPEGERGPLVAYDLTTGNPRFTLPAGVRSADGDHYFAAALDGTDTQLGGYDLATGAALGALRLPGQWSLNALSPTGRWAALTEVIADTERQSWTNSSDWHSRFQIVDTEGRLTPQALDLPGNFEVDALSSRGDSLYVIEYLPADKPDHYQVRLYDLAAHALIDGALVDKREPDEVMWGERWDALGSRDGQWQLTLYLRADEGIAFVHALDFDNRFTLCLDLPGQSDSLDSLKYYSLALAPRSQIVYAANPALGIIARINLADFSVSTVAKFGAVEPDSVAATTSRSVMSPDGNNLYFTDGARAWAYDIQKHAVRRLTDLGGINGLGLSPDGSRLYLATQNTSLAMFDTASGQPLSFQAASAGQ